MFRAFWQATVGFDDPDGHIRLRRQVVSWMRENLQEIQPLLDQDVVAYVERMANPDSWGGAPELVAISKMTDLKIGVLVKGDTGKYSWSVVGSGDLTVLLSLEGGHYENLVSQRELRA